ncbi:hypothetical protein BDR26DRAFT_557623 [Obelidium mucronatum]|nr:hypothetical protein BDR26DRAFT_557623 [Obelidium mucronatum]
MDNRLVLLLERIQSDIALVKGQQNSEFAVLNSRLSRLESTLENALVKVDTTTAAITSHTESLQKQLSSTHFRTSSRLNTLSSQLRIVTNSYQKFHTSLNNTPEEIITQIFSWIDSCQVFKFRRLNRRVDSILTTAHFAVLNQTKFDTIIREDLHDGSLEGFFTVLGKGISKAFALAPSSFQTVFARRYRPLLKTLSNSFDWDFTDMRKDDSEWRPVFSKSLCERDWIEELSIFNVQGPIPKEIGRLTLLKYFQISVSEVGAIPADISGCVNLRHFGISECQFKGGFPQEITGLVTLTSLNLCNNQLEGSLPIDLGVLRNLVDLDLCQNQFSGTLPESIGNLVNLEYLDLSINHFTGAVPETLGNLILLQNLVMKQNDFTGSLPLVLLQLIALEECDFRDNPHLDCNFDWPLLKI